MRFQESSRKGSIHNSSLVQTLLTVNAQTQTNRCSVSWFCGAQLWQHQWRDWFFLGAVLKNTPQSPDQLIKKKPSDRYSAWPRYRLSNRCLIICSGALCPARLDTSPPLPSPSTNLTDPFHPEGTVIKQEIKNRSKRLSCTARIFYKAGAEVKHDKGETLSRLFCFHSTVHQSN